MTNSQRLFAQALKLMPGGVNSPVRALRAVGGDPIFMERGEGSRLTDVDGRSYIDYVMSWGPLIAGHAHPEVVETVTLAARNGTSFGACTAAEVELAGRIQQAFPSVERVRLTSSGTEATMSALRVARAATAREKILKFEGCYHGHADSLLVKAGSGVATLGLPDSPGVPRALAELTVTVPFNDFEAVEQAFQAHRRQLAAVIVEPIAGNMGCVPPRPGFLPKLRQLTSEQGTVLIFDEVITGFRVARGGAQELYGIKPDLTTLGKIIGGGLPVGAYGGRADLMNQVAPAGPVYQAGTLSGNPLAVAAGARTLEIIARPGFYAQLERLGQRLEGGLVNAAAERGVALEVNRVGSMFTAFFTAGAVEDYGGARRADTRAFGCFFRALLERGVYWPPSQFETAFLSAAHSAADVDGTIAAAFEALEAVQASRSSGPGLVVAGGEGT